MIVQFSRIALLCAAPLSAVLAQRQDSTRADSVARLAPVHVVGSVIPAAGPAVGAGVPARVSVLSGAEVERAQPRLLTEALTSAGLMSGYDDLGSAFKHTIVTRGFTASPVVGLPQGVTVFLDGIPVNEPDAGQVNFDLLPMSLVDRLEMLGGTTALLGPNSLGGSVNLISRDALRPESEVSVSLGSHGRQALSASSAFHSGHVRMLTGVEGAREDGWRALTSARVGSAFLRAAIGGEERGATLLALGGRSYAETAGSLPRSVYATRPDSNLSAGDFEDLQQLHLALSGHAPLAGGRGTASIWTRAHRAERFNVNQQADPDVRGFSRNGTLGARAQWSADRTVRTGILELHLGTGGSVNDVNIRLFAERIDPGLTTHVQSPIRKLDAHAAVGYRRGRASISGSARFDAVQVPFHNRLRPERDTVSTYLQVSPRVGVGFEVGRGATVYASLGQGFRAPAVIELACADPEEPCPLPFALGDDPPLAPVIATTREIGAHWRRGALGFTAAAFRTDVQDDIFLFPYHDETEPDGSTIDGYFANIPRTRREGVELDGEALLRSGHRFSVRYAYTNATFRSGGVELFSIREAEGGDNEVSPGDRMPLVPDHALSAQATITVGGGVALDASTAYVGRRWLRGDEANEERPLSGYVTSSVGAHYVSERWDFRATVLNVLNNDYAAFGTFNINQGAGNAVERFLTPGDPRSFRLSLTRRF